MSPSRFNQTGPKIGLSVRLAETQAEIEAAQRLRYQVFAQELGAEIESDDGRDVDPYDEHCHHLLAFDDATGEVIGCYRLITEETAKKVGGWYSEHEFDLEPLKDILPCKHSFFQTAYDAGVPIIPALCRYPNPDGSSPNPHTAYYGDISLWQSICMVISQPSSMVELHFLDPIEAGEDRYATALHVHALLSEKQKQLG